MVGRGEPRPRLDDRGRDAEPGVDLGQLAARRAAPQDQQAGRQLPGQSRIAVRPDRDGFDALERRDLRVRADRDDDVAGRQLVGGAVVADRHSAGCPDRRLTAVDDGAGLGERLDVSRIVGFPGVGSTVDHVVARSRRCRPVVGGWIGVMPSGAVQQRLRRQAADERAAPPEPAPIDDGDRGPQLTRLVRSRLAAWPRTDDHEVEGIHRHSFR